MQRQLNKRRRETAPIYFITTYSAHKQVVADLTRTLQTLEGVRSSSRIHLILVELYDSTERMKNSKLDLNRFFKKRPKIRVTQLGATFSGIGDFAGIPDVPLALHTCSSEVVSRDAVSATGAIKSDAGIAHFGRLSNAYDLKFFRMLLEAKSGRGAVAVPVAFLSYPGQELFAPVVKDGEMLGFVGAPAESLALSGMIIQFSLERGYFQQYLSHKQGWQSRCPICYHFRPGGTFMILSTI